MDLARLRAAPAAVVSRVSRRQAAAEPTHTITDVVEEARRHRPSINVGLIERAHQVAAMAHEGQLRASEISRDRVEDARSVLKAGEEVEAKVTGIDRKSRVISLSIRAKEAHEEAQAIQEYQTDSGRTGAGTTLGDLLKEQMTPE